MKPIPRLLLTFILLAATSALAQTESSLAKELRALIEEKGLVSARARADEVARKNFPDFRADENELNSLGYDYLQQDRLPEALFVFGLYLDRFPNSGNAHDSYGEALIHQGDAPAALAAYRRSLELDPKNRNAEAMIAALTGPDGFVALQQRVKLQNEFQAIGGLGEGKRAAALPKLRAQLDAYLKDYPEAKAAPQLVSTFFRIAESTGLPNAVATWRTFKNHADPRIAELAAAKEPLIAAIETPIELKFTAVDGREVDLAALRGKVVLLDFWATWCGPCIAELPNVRQAYEKYHAQGFEVIGVSLDGPVPKEKLVAWLKEKDLPWPQHFDGQAWKTEPAARYNIRAIPAAYLLDKTGRLVSINARGPALDVLVRRHLGLTP